MTHPNGERQGGSRITKEKAGLKSYTQEFSRVKNYRTLFLFLPHGIVGLYGLCLDDHRGITSLRVLLLVGDDPRHIAGGKPQASRHSRATLAPLSRHSRATLVPLRFFRFLRLSSRMDSRLRKPESLPVLLYVCYAGFYPVSSP